MFEGVLSSPDEDEEVLLWSLTEACAKQHQGSVALYVVESRNITCVLLKGVDFERIPLNTVAKCNMCEKIVIGSCSLMQSVEVSHGSFRTD